MYGYSYPYSFKSTPHFLTVVPSELWWDSRSSTTDQTFSIGRTMGYAFLYVLSFILVLKFAESLTEDCPDLYLRYSKDHSFCKPKNSSCNIQQTYLTEVDIAQILELHNSFRSYFAMQSEKNAKLPTAANMLQMEWDNELAAVAQRYSDQCIFAHDKPNQRRVQNFDVGQNIAMQTLKGQNLLPPKPDWSFAVITWFEEIIYFSSDLVCPFQAPPSGRGEYRHFSQITWANTFRVGCGYTLYQNGDTYTRLYVCNYGPSGNVYDTCVYEIGVPCSQCPQNTCCGESCLLDRPTYPGLCKRYNNEAPITPVKQPTLFNCNFQDGNKEDCLISIEGPANWYIMPALGGSFLETVLSAGQSSSITFSKHLWPHSNAFCVQIRYRKGPKRDGSLADNTATETLTIPSLNSFTFTQTLPSYSDQYQHQFNSFNLTLSWDKETELRISFAVGPHADPQFFNIDSIIAVDKAC